MKQLWQIGNIVALAFALVANILVGAQLIAVPAVNDVSDAYATFLTPASYAFSIWSLIYILLIVFVVYQARDVFKPRPDNTLPVRIGPLFIIASICNGLWTYVFVNDFVGLSVLILLILTASLYIIMWRLNIAMNNPGVATIVAVWWPILIYTGWVTIATVVNIASWLASLGIVVSVTSTVIALIVLTIGLLGLLIDRNVRELVLACVWAIAAIGVRQMGETDGQIVAVTAYTVAAVLFIGCGVHAFIYRRENPFLNRT